MKVKMLLTLQHERNSIFGKKREKKMAPKVVLIKSL